MYRRVGCAITGMKRPPATTGHCYRRLRVQISMRLGYLYSRYPVISQTFCDAEMLALERRGIELVIGSIYPPLTSLRHEYIARFARQFIMRRPSKF